MGTTYSISHDASTGKISKQEIDSILVIINNSVSTYIENSTISLINNNKNLQTDTIHYLKNGNRKKKIKITLPYDEIFSKNYETSEKIYLETNGAFDPSVMPLVNYWGFGYKSPAEITSTDTQEVNKILEYVGMDKFEMSHDQREMTIIKPEKGQLDFSAIAKGYAVDVISNYLLDNNIKNHMVEIGGEIFTMGRNEKNEKWNIGLNKPQENASINSIQDIISFSNKGLASSGNYRNFRIIDGIKYGHEINPETGYPETTDLLGVSVIGESTMHADSYATALMIMGKEKAIQFINSTQNTETILYHSGSEGNIITSYSENASQYIKKENS